MVLGLRNKNAEAEEAFRTAISLAPTYAEPYAHLADLRVRQGYVRDGVRLIEKAVRYAPQVAQYAERLEAYRAVVAHGPESLEEPAVPPPQVPITHDADAPATKFGDWPFAQRLTKLDWRKLGERLTHDGCVMIPALLDDTTCAQLRGMFDNDELFAKTVVMDREDSGEGFTAIFGHRFPRSWTHCAAPSTPMSLALQMSGKAC